MTRTRKLVALLLLVAVVAASGISIALASDTTDTYAYLPNHSVYFYDVSDGYAWAHREVDALALSDVVRGSGNHLFYPDQAITRADFVVMLDRAYRMSAMVSSGAVADQGSFSDVPANAYYSDAVKAAKAFSVTTGTSDGRFEPNAPLTRQDAMVFLKRTLDRTDKTLGRGALTGFSDIEQIASYARAPVAALVGAQIVGGSDGRINPTAAVTRAEMAVMLYRSTHLIVQDSGVFYEKRSDVINICIGAQLYGDVVIENYDPTAYYGELMAYTALRQKDGVTYITLGENQPIDRTMTYENGQMTFNDPTAEEEGATVTYPVASDCASIDVSPYHLLAAPVNTGGDYRYCYPSIVDGQVRAVYYAKA